MTHSMDSRLLIAGLLALSASLASLAAERLSDLDLSQTYGSSFRSQVLDAQDEWRADDTGSDWRSDEDEQKEGRIEFGYDEIREHQRIQEMLDQSSHDFGPSSATVMQYRF